MPANVEKMFYVSNEANDRFVPWHGLGTPVEAAVTSAEAIDIAGLNWTVEQKPLYIDKVNEVPNYFANVRSSDNSVLGIVGNRYKIIQNSEAFDFTDSLLDEGVVYETAGSLRNGKTIWLLAKMPERAILGDKFDPYICFTNNHDGFGSVRACMTPTRVVCANTLALALDGATKSWRTSHTGDLKGKLQEAREALQLANLYMDALDKEADILATQKFSDADYKRALELMFPVDKDNDSERKQKNVEVAKQNIYFQFETYV